MAINDNESCGSRSTDLSSNNPWQQKQKLQVYNEVLRRLKDLNNQESNLPGFDDDLWSHFQRLPTSMVLYELFCDWRSHFGLCDRYAVDVNVERAEDVLTHKRLLLLAHDPANRPAFEVRLVQVLPVLDENSVDSIPSIFPKEEDAQSPLNYLGRQSIHPPPAFGSSPNLEALALEATKSHDKDGGSVAHANPYFARPMHEITFSTDDKPKLLSQLTSLLAEIGLNIQEAHAFSTTDGYSLDVFVVEGWPYEETEQLRQVLEMEIVKIEKKPLSNQDSLSSIIEHAQTGTKANPDHVKIPNDETDVWEIDVRLLKFEKKVASGSYGDLYKGTYFSQEVAIKVLKPERVNADMQQEFAQEVYIMRKIRHKNVVQFIGACTRPPSLCIVTEFMSGGSVYDFLHKHKGVFKLPTLLKVAIDISKGMDYLHQNNIVHRDLKAANLLMDENEIPYEYLTPLQAAVGVVQKGLRPTIPKNTHPKLSELLEKCWQQDPSLRPDFSEIIEILRQIAKEVGEEGDDRRKEKSGRFLSVLRRGHH
ncbi:hypothetical protein IFM89_027605 [Coptis chinensis]|uniref:non-specific serine/threonine protein kinase n=1 Tax=Coptis chinensis TaxID=261450 RepID=A0A835IPI4_9MAGN|nr:hypothetical protein IFM89_027605 [Coptis chinensis]